MPQSLIQINGVTGSDTDLPLNTLVQLSNVDTGGEVSYLWVILDQPSGTTDNLSSTSIQNPTFTPKKEGTYLIKLTVNGTLTNQVVAAVLQLKTRLRVPIAGESIEADPVEGWGAAVESSMRKQDSDTGNPYTVVARASVGGLLPNDVLYAPGEATIKGGLPGQEIVLNMAKALATSATSLDNPLYVLERGVNGSLTPASGDLIVCRVSGRVGPLTGIPSASGDPVYVSDTGTVALSPGTNERRIGTVLQIISGTTYSVSFDGSANIFGILTSSAPVNVDTNAAVVGVLGTAAHADHKHKVSTGVPGSITIGASAAEGTSVTLARSDHTHALAIPSAPLDVAKVAAAAGASAIPAREDHQHSISTGTPTQLMGNAVLAEGTATSLARSDHTHSVSTTGTISSISAGSASADGTADGLARKDHVHSVSTGTPATIGTVNSGGVSNALPRLDHVHAHGNLVGGTLHADATTSTAGFLSASDKQRVDDLRLGTVRIAVRNETGVTILKGKAIAPNGTFSPGIPTVALASKDVGSLRPAIGLIAADLPTATTGEAIVLGVLQGIDTSALSLTDVLALGTSGNLIRPFPDTFPFTGEQQTVASVIRVHATLGELFVNMDQTLTGEAGGDLAGNLPAPAVVALTTTSGPTSLVIGAVADGEFLRRSGSTLISAPAANITSSAPVDVIKSAAQVGVATTAARADHRHDVSTATAGSITIGASSGEGSASSLARSDHIHSFAAPAAPVNVTKAAASAGTATEAARADHKHDVTTAVVGTISVGDAAAEGTATSLARSDHTHALTAPGAPANVTKAAASAGVATTVARSDHKHDVTTAAVGSITYGATNTEGTATSLARSDHTHAFGSPAAPADVTKSAASAGTASEAARADHKHDISTAVVGAILVGDSAAEGTATSLARSDHKHSLGAPAAPADVTKAAASAGSAMTVARSDHKHDISTAAVGGITYGATNTEGTATSLARSDHTHAFGTPAAPANVTKAAAAAGTATESARADHKHDISTAAVVTMAFGNTNTEGTATSLARSDHTHQFASPAAPANVTKAAASAGTAAEAARADHKHDITTATASDLTTSSTSTEGTATSLARSDHTHKVSVTVTSATATADSTTTSTTDVAMNSMSITPGAGDYWVSFTASMGNSNNNQSVFFSIYSNGSQITSSERGFELLTPANTRHVGSTNAYITGLSGGQAIEIRWRVSANTGTVRQRTLLVMKVN